MEKSKLLGLLVFFVFACTIHGCKDDHPKGTDLSGTYVIVEQNTKSIPNGLNLANLTLIESKDTRCPPNAVCVTAGSVLAKVKFEDAESEQIIELCLGACTAEIKTITSKGIKYYISLSAFMPYNGAIGLANVRPTATIKIAKAN